MKRIRMWMFKQVMKDRMLKQIIQREKELYARTEAIAYSNWISRCQGFGYPKKENGDYMTCWELYDYFHNHSPKRNAFTTHANFVRPEWEKY